MPLELQVFRASEFIRLGANGRLDLDASRETLGQLARACSIRGVNRALLDLREVQVGPVPMLSSKDMADLVASFCRMGFSTTLRLAVLYTADPHRRARLFAFMATLRGWNVRASENFEEALMWLWQGGTPKRRKAAGEQEIPIQVRPSAAAAPSSAQAKPSPGRRPRLPASEKRVPVPMRRRR